MKRILKIIRNILIILLVIFIFVVIFFTIRGRSKFKTAIKETDLDNKISSLEQNTKYYTYYNDIPEHYMNAVIAVEDHRFYDHKGFDFIGLIRALVANITAQSPSQGGSTITQQLAKNMYFNQGQNIDRKIAEAFMASHMEKSLSKEKILELYVNIAYYGDGYYGLGQASRGYFKKEPKDLTLFEATLLAGVPNAPSVYAPTVNLDLCLKRQTKVINDMLKYNYIDTETANKLKEEQNTFNMDNYKNE